MGRNLSPAERLIVAADFTPNESGLTHLVRKEVLDLAGSISGTGACLKVNSALRVCGQDLIPQIQNQGLGVFADYKLFDIRKTLTTDGAYLRARKPEILTVFCNAGVEALRALKEELPDTEVLGVTILTSLGEEEVQAIYGCSVMEAVLRLASIAAEAGIDGLVSSAHEVEMLRKEFGDQLSLNTPGIRPKWANVKNDDQNRIMTPTEAIQRGVDRVVIGRPITGAEDPRAAVERTIAEIASAM